MIPAINWDVSATFDISGLSKDTYPNFFTIFNARWKSGIPDSEGWFNIERMRGTANVSAYGTYSRLFFICNEEQLYKITVEYQEEISFFLNGRFILHNDFNPDNPVGSFEIEILSKKGINELFIFLISRSKNWKFRVTSIPVLTSHHIDHTLSEILWETESNLLTPESVLYDPENKVFYVSSFDNMYYKQGYPTGFISRFSEDGKMLDHEWIKGLFAPTGMCLNNHNLHVVTRFGVVVFDTKKGEYITQFDIQGGDFLNDITVDSLGRIYITNSSGDPDKPDIYIIEKNEVKPWIQSDMISNANGIYEYRGKLLIGNNGEGLFQSIDLDNQNITTICSLGVGTIDGIRIDNQGNWLVSHWEGKIFRITRQGEITEIFDSRLNGYNAADFEFLGKDNLLIIPTYVGNRIVALKLKY
jgi:sugar lactone lactonase YvrE